jgi:hypothetical protein
LKLDGANFVLTTPNKRLFSFLKWQHTNEEENSCVQFVKNQVGCKVNDHLQKVFTKKNRSKIDLEKKIKLKITL